MKSAIDTSSFTIFTSVEELKGYEEKNGANRPPGVNHGENINREAWVDRRHREKNFIGSEPTVLIIGAGQAGLNLAARLGQLNISTLVVDKNNRIGDNWRNRYRFLVLHDPVWYDHMAYIPFPKHWPVFVSLPLASHLFAMVSDSLDTEGQASRLVRELRSIHGAQRLDEDRNQGC